MARNTTSIAAVALMVLSARTALAAATPVGLTVYAEGWNPAKANGESLQVLVSNPTLLSDTLNSAWGVFRSWYLATVPGMLHAPDYLYTESQHAVPKGITLYSRTHDINKPPEMTLAPQVSLTLVPEGANAFRANFLVPGSTISLCSTTPTVAGQYADPCVDLAVDLTFSLSLKISDAPNQLLSITAANISLANFQYSKGNWSTDVALAIGQIVTFLGGPNYQALLVNTIDSTNVSVEKDMQTKAIQPLDNTLGRYEQTALTAINQQLAPAAKVSSLIHLAVWAQNQPNAQMLNLLFAPPSNGITIDPAHQSGQFSGTLTFDDSIKTLPACSALNTSQQFTGQVQIGPRPIVAINGGAAVYGTAPTQALSVAFAGGALQGRQCPYTLSHLAIGLPNILNFSNFPYRATGGASVTEHLQIQPSQWSSPVVLGPNGTVVYAGTVVQAQPGTVSRALKTGGLPSNLQALNLVASLGISVQTGVGALPRQGRIATVSPVDPAMSQATKAPTWGATPQATAVTPSWAPAAQGGAVTGSSLQRAATINRAATLPVQQQAAPQAAPSSLRSP